MKLPALNTISVSRDYTQDFLGYNAQMRIGENEFAYTKNLTTDYFPLISPRSAHGYIKKIEKFKGMIGKDALAYISGTTFVYNDKEYTDLGLVYTDSDKLLVSMGAYILIFPDGKYFNTADESDRGSLGAKFTTVGTVRFELSTEDGTPYDYTVSKTAPKTPKNGEYWLDTSGELHNLKVYSEATGAWTSVSSVYIKISSGSIGQSFEQYDGVTISGCTAKGTDDLNTTMVIWGKGDDYLLVQGILDKTVSQTAPVTVERKIPKMDYVVESNNRIWGCRYGEQGDQVVNELYACKLGDPKNWNCFMGVSSDSYAVSLGSDGRFTGAVNHLGYPIFFKETGFHKVYGEIPANFQVQFMPCRGVQCDSDESLCLVNDTLFYKSEHDVMAFDGSMPVSISANLGNTKYTNARAGALGDKYYICMRDRKGWHLFVYDTKRGIWMHEDEVYVRKFAHTRNDLFYIVADGDDRKLYSMAGTVGTLENNIEWVAESGNIGYSYADKKYLSRFNIRMKLYKGSVVSTYVKYDSCGDWEFVGKMTGHTVQSFNLPIIPRRCDHMAVKLVGRGDAKIFSMSKILEVGSDE